MRRAINGSPACVYAIIFMGEFIHDGFMSARGLACAGGEAGVWVMCLVVAG